jgi:DNA-binding winged helix-turn-helix (wHTH) protein/TolB-like protein
MLSKFLEFMARSLPDPTRFSADFGRELNQGGGPDIPPCAQHGMTSLPGKPAGDGMDESTHDAGRGHSIDLAQETDFDLGSLRVRPARCEVEGDGGPQTLQRRVMQVLVALAQARGSVVSQNDLVARCWRGLAVSDDAIVRCIGILRKLAAGYPDAPFAIETTPGVGYRLTSPSLTEGVAATSDRRLSIRAPGVAAAIALALLVVGMAWIGYNRSISPHGPARVAVQLFEALGSSGDAKALAKSIPNAIVDALGDSQVEAALADGGTDKNAGKSAAPQPGLIVTGILRDDGRNTSVNLRIEDAASRTALWATEFTRRSSEVSDLPLEVAAHVTDIVNTINFARSANPPLTDDSALSALLQTTDMIRDAQGGDWAQMIEHAQGIVARHPEFAFGHDTLAYAYETAAENIDLPDRARAMRDAARREAKLTLKLDPADAGAYAILADLEPTYDYGAQEAILLRGLKTATRPKGALGGLYSSESRLQQNVGRFREGLATQLAAHAVDQWGAPKTAQLVTIYANTGDLGTARKLIEKGIRRWPNHSGIRARRQYIAGFYEDPSNALKILDSLDALQSPPQSSAIWRSFVKAKVARSEQVTGATLREIRNAADKGLISREYEIMMFAGLGEPRQAIEAANSALDQHQDLRAWFLFTPVTRNLRQDPGFVGLASRMGLIKYWRETGKRPDFCADQARRSECSPQLLAALK